MCLFLLLSAHALLLSRIHTSPALCSSLWDLKSCQSQKIYAASCWPTDDIEVIFAPDLCARLHGSRKLLLLIVSKIGLLTDHMDSSTSFKVTRFPKKKKKSYRSLNHTTVSSGVRLADVKVISASAFFFFCKLPRKHSTYRRIYMLYPRAVFVSDNVSCKSSRVGVLYRVLHQIKGIIN
jgi:hypothetical protein